MIKAGGFMLLVGIAEGTRGNKAEKQIALVSWGEVY